MKIVNGKTRNASVLKSDIIGLMREASRSLNTLVIMYMDANGSVSERETEPYEIKDGKYWAFCLEKGAVRQFTIDRIMGAYITKQKFRPRFPVKIY